MAEYLVECLLADALLLEQWGDQEPSLSLQELDQHTGQGPESMSTRPPALEQASAAVERRRQLNRESMRRTRKRTRCGIESMRSTLTTLAQEFNALCEHQRAKQRGVALVRLEEAYTTLAETSHRLKTEKLYLKRVLMEHEKSKLRMIDVINNARSCGLKRWEEPATQYFEYVAITKTQAQSAIASAYRSVMELDKTARPLSDWIGCVGDPMRTFGWRVKCEISSGHNFFLSMTKRLDNVRPDQVIDASWAFITRERRPDDREPARTQQLRRIARSDLLQVLDDDTRVMGFDWHHPVKPGVRMRSIGLRFRTKTEQGFALGLSPMNPQDPAMRRLASPSIEFRDGFTWHDCVADGDSCVITFRSLVQYNTLENLHQRLVDLMGFYWQWEGDVLQRPARVFQF